MPTPLHELPPLLLPAPRRLALTGPGAEAPAPLTFGGDFPASMVEDMLPGAQPRPNSPWIEGKIAPALPPQAYSLRVNAEGVKIQTGDHAGLRHALATLAQLLRQYPARLPGLVIDDAPAVAKRGLMLDISRDRVPTMEFLSELVRTLCGLKVNHLQLYTEHSFAYRGHEAVWKDASPMTPEEIRRLDALCARSGIELAANQNCFGHLSSWLRHPEYAHLAETHGDWMFDRWPRSGPFSLCPTDPRSLAFVEDLLDQLLPCFSSPLVNIGCDETYDIAFGRSKDEVAKRGRATVYAGFVNAVARIAQRHGKAPMFWGDIALSRPESLGALTPALIPLLWGYEPDAPFDRWCENYTAKNPKAPLWICPGTSAWRGFTGRTHERHGNLAAAASAATAHGAAGMLICEWGDLGHRQQWPVALHAIAHGASAAWSGSASFHADACSLQVLGDVSLMAGAWLEEFGDVDRELRQTCGALSRPDLPHLRNQTALFADLHTPWGAMSEVGNFSLWRQARERVGVLAARIPRLPEPMHTELSHASDAAAFALDRAITRRRPASEQAEGRASLRRSLPRLIDEHRRLWRLRSRVGGLRESSARYESLAPELEP